MADPEWDKLVARGVAARGRTEDAAARAKDRETEQASRKVERRRAARRRESASVLLAYRAWPGTVLAGLLVLLPIPWAYELPGLGQSGTLALVLGLGGALMVGLGPVIEFLLRGHGTRCVAREELWAQKLPFPLEGYVELLGHFSDAGAIGGQLNPGWLRVEVAEGASLAELADACRGVDPTLKIVVEEDALRIEHEQLLNRDRPNRRYLTWVHHIADDVLVPLAAHASITRTCACKYP